MTLEDFTDDDEQSLKSPKTRRARRKTVQNLRTTKKTFGFDLTERVPRLELYQAIRFVR